MTKVATIWPGCAVLLAAALSLDGCSNAAPQPAPAAVEVLTTRVAPMAVTVTDELPGRVVAYRVAEIRPQVGGIVRRRLFEQGGIVRAGQPLFQIETAPFRADADTARATLQKATAVYDRARVQADRLQPLVAADAISRQAYDDAVATRQSAAADVAEARATLRRRRLDIGFARVTAPIGGWIGPANVTEGALVAAADAAPLATVQQIDRVYVDVRQPVERFAALREAAAAGASDGAVDILTGAGRRHPAQGHILFSGVTVDPGTGDALVRVLVNNPGGLLLPGMFVRARLPRVAIPAALTVPQQAVTRDGNGDSEVNVVDAQDRAHARRVDVGDVIDGRYVVLSGLRAGEIVIVVGHDRIRPGVPVRPRPWRAPAHAAR